MPRLALTLIVFWFLSLFVFRSVWQWWRTGSTGLKGFSGSVGSLEWNAGLLASAGLAASALAPIAALRAWPGGELLLVSVPVFAFGALLTVIGIAGALLAQLTMGDSWRIGVDEAERTTLVTQGLYRWIRNPIFSFVLLSGAGLVLLVPNLLSILAFALTAAGIEIQVRVVEEPYLSRTHGSDYQAYRSRTGRFFPGLGR